MSDRLFVATRKGLFRVERQNSEWKVVHVSFLGDHVTMMLRDPRDSTLYAALNHGHFGVKLHRSKNLGETWDEIGAPKYPAKPEGDAEDKNPWALSTIWSLEPGGKNEPGVLWAGTIPGGLFKSTDYGDSWSLNEPLWNHPARKQWFGGGADQPGIHSIAVDPRNSRRLTVAVSCGGVWLTENGGETWEVRTKGMWAAFMPESEKEKPEIQDPHRLVACPAQPDAMYVQHHNAAFVSFDEGKNWRDLTALPPSVFGFAVAVHPRDPKTAWFIPAVKDEKRVPVDGKLVVTRTRDGGETFEVLREGLPQEHAYDIAYRHALDVDDTGACLAFGTTTGSLFVSENGGDAWKHVSAHLPLVTAVRFG
jgi:hypothetical protein